MHQDTNNYNTETQLAVMAENIKRIDDTLLSFDKKIEKIADNLVSQNDFIRLEKQVNKHEAQWDEHIADYQSMKGDMGLVKRIVYGTVGMVLTSVLSGILYLVVNVNGTA